MNAWLVRITLDPRHPQVRDDLGDAARMHQRMMTLLPENLGLGARSLAGLLYRVEENREGVRILAQTRLEPDTSRLPTGYGHVATRELAPLLDGLRPGSAVHYRLVANASKRLSRGAGRDEGKVIPLRGNDADEWWAGRAPGCGLTLRTTTAFPLDDATGRRRDQRVRHALTRYDGIAVVTDPDALRRALLGGIGRGKSYGAGLLSLAPLRAAA